MRAPCPLPRQAAHDHRQQCRPRRTRRRQPPVPCEQSVTEQTNVKNREAHEAAEKLATYEWGFSSDIEQEFAPKGLSEDTVRFISAKKGEPEWLLEWRLKAFRAWHEMEEVSWAERHLTPRV